MGKREKAAQTKLTYMKKTNKQTKRNGVNGPKKNVNKYDESIVKKKKNLMIHPIQNLFAIFLF